ncbi:uncharacterized protein LOC130641608 isoform X3 [Hydractinia symbiolongicarpus]|uniref:uncharacterized protein LOC130641608 isoform X3 n=1 Tax=Hydractinia symbiolongicarpus TaxID=13093 RepID=UPI00254A6E7A|nr:uncharacterized protein LOC130641608 isoform X3 [Hydractinia symbiolongicarpus]
MSAVGSDAAFMLERALEEMDDIFKDNGEPTTFVQSTPETKKRKGKTLLEVKKLLDDIEFTLSSQVLDVQEEELNIEEKRLLTEHFKSLSFLSSLFQECTKPYNANNIMFHSTGPEEKLHKLEQERIESHKQVGKLHEQLMHTEADLEKTKKTLTEYARKNEELLIRITEYRIADQKMLEECLFTISPICCIMKWLSYPLKLWNVTGTLLINHNQLLLPDEEDDEMDKLKTHIGADGLTGLKSRLREKASECNRLKLQLEDMKQIIETKDNSIVKMQEQIQRLFEENEILRSQLANVTSLHSNGPLLHSPDIVSNCSLSRGGPESVHSSTSASKSELKSKDLFQIKSLKSASEPNLIENRLTIGLISTPSSVNGDDALYRPFKRMISESPFVTWTSDQVQDWLRDEGLEEYVNACAKCVRRGEELLKFTYAEYERDLGITDPLIKKKLNLALKAVTSNGPDYAGRLDHHWVARWLEDLGLPQYKMNFLLHKIDGRVLINMNVDDILQLKVYSLLHHTSLKRAIQFLRHQKFHPQFLREIANQSEERCDHVMLWTCQRIVHWLRSVDLAEYAPNLRGSGVHGALMVLEPRFNAETLANLLSIPANKTLLRRHVNTQFSTLLGDACQRQKEMTAKTSDFVPLNGSEKHKLRKKGLSFGTLRRRKSETDLESLICPMELDVSNIYSPPPALDPEIIFDLSESTSLSPSFTNDCGSESTNDTSAAPRIAELSQEIDQMTSMLGSERN